MAFYDRIKGRTAEQILEVTGGMGNNDVWHGDEGELMRVSAQVRATQEQIVAQNLSSGNVVEAVNRLMAAQDNATRHMVECTNALVASQDSATNGLVASIGTLTASINRASTDSGKLGTKILILTGALALVGVGQIFATAWPYLAWWWHH